MVGKEEEQEGNEKQSKLYDYRKFYMIAFGLIGVTGLVSVFIGVRDVLVMSITGITIIICVWLYMRKRKKPDVRERGKVKKIIYPLVAVLIGVISIFITIDHVRYTATTGKILQEEGSYTTVVRCVTDRTGSRSCLHDSKDKVVIYSIDKAGDVEARDITDTIKKYTDE